MFYEYMSPRAAALTGRMYLLKLGLCTRAPPLTISRTLIDFMCIVLGFPVAARQCFLFRSCCSFFSRLCIVSTNHHLQPGQG